jgi:hypothetical protein
MTRLPAKGLSLPCSTEAYSLFRIIGNSHRDAAGNRAEEVFMAPAIARFAGDSL